MKNLIIFLFGAAFGVGGTLLYLRKDIKKELETIRVENEKKKAEDDVPFTVEELKQKESKPESINNTKRTDYNKISSASYGKKTEPKVVMMTNSDSEDGDEESDILPEDETDGGVYEIDSGEFMRNHDYAKDRLVYYSEDRIMASENGTIIEKPFPLVGGEWETCVGNYAERTAFIRNTKLLTDYEIYVESCAYRDEWGDD